MAVAGSPQLPKSSRQQHAAAFWLILRGVSTVVAGQGVMEELLDPYGILVFQPPVAFRTALPVPDRLCSSLWRMAGNAIVRCCSLDRERPTSWST